MIKRFKDGIYAGADPDCSVFTMAIVRVKNGVPEVLSLLHDKGDLFAWPSYQPNPSPFKHALANAKACAIEYPIKLPTTPNVNSLIRLAASTGWLACLAGDIARLVTPQEWKGTVPKNIHQARTYSRFGWEYKQGKSYSYPVGVFPEINRSLWSDMGDSLGLALYASTL